MPDGNEFEQLKRIDFPLYENFPPGLFPTIKGIKALREPIEIAQRTKIFLPEKQNLWNRFPTSRTLFPQSSGPSDFQRWSQQEQNRGLFLGDKDSNLATLVGDRLGCKMERLAHPHEFRAPIESWRDELKNKRLVVLEHTSPYYHRPHLMFYDVHEEMQNNLEKGEVGIIWCVVPGRRGRIFEGRSEFLRECRCPDLSYHHFSDTVRTGLYALIDSHIFFDHITLEVPVEVTNGLSPEELKRIWALSWEKELDATAFHRLHHAITESSYEFGYTERHFLWYVNGREKSKAMEPRKRASRANRLRAAGTLCAAADEFQRLVPSIEFWSCTIAHTLLPATRHADHEETTALEQAPSIDQAQPIPNTLEYGYQWPFLFDPEVVRRNINGHYNSAVCRLVPPPWLEAMAISDDIKLKGRLDRDTNSNSFLAYPRFFQSRAVTPSRPKTPAAEGDLDHSTEDVSLAHIYKLVDGLTDDYAKARAILTGEAEQVSYLSGDLRCFPESLRDALEATKEYVSSYKNLREERAHIDSQLSCHAAHLDEVRTGEETGSVWFVGVGYSHRYSHRRSRNSDPDIVNAPDLRAGFFATFFFRDRKATPSARELLIRHRGRIAADIERILAKLAAELVEERETEERASLQKAELTLDSVMAPITRMMYLQRQAREESEQLALLIGQPGSTLLEARDIATTLFRDRAIIEIGKHVFLQSQHSGFQGRDVHYALAYFLLRFYRRAEELKTIQFKDELQSVAASVLQDALRRTTYEAIREQLLTLTGATKEIDDDVFIKELIFGIPASQKKEDWHLDLQSSSLSKAQHTQQQSGRMPLASNRSQGGELPWLRAYTALERIKDLLHSSFKLGTPWKAKSAEIALATVAREISLDGSASFEMGSRLPFTHGDWIDCLVIVAQSLLRPTYYPYEKKGKLTFSVSHNVYKVNLTGKFDRAGQSVDKIIEAGRKAFETGLEVGADPRLSTLRFGDLGSAFRLLGALFRFVPGQESPQNRGPVRPQSDFEHASTRLLGWYRLPVTYNARTFTLAMFDSRESGAQLTCRGIQQENTFGIELEIAEISKPLEHPASQPTPTPLPATTNETPTAVASQQALLFVDYSEEGSLHGEEHNPFKIRPLLYELLGKYDPKIDVRFEAIEYTKAGLTEIVRNNRDKIIYLHINTRNEYEKEFIDALLEINPGLQFFSGKGSARASRMNIDNFYYVLKQNSPETLGGLIFDPRSRTP